jgi:hypothetical protein
MQPDHCRCWDWCKNSALSNIPILNFQPSACWLPRLQDMYNKDIRMNFDISIPSAHFILHLFQKFHIVIYMTKPYQPIYITYHDLIYGRLPEVLFNALVSGSTFIRPPKFNFNDWCKYCWSRLSIFMCLLLHHHTIIPVLIIESI